MTVWRSILAALVLAASAAGGGHSALAREPEDGGVKIGRPSLLRKLVSAEKLEHTAELQYTDLTSKAAAKHALLPESHPQVQRLRKIADRLLPHAPKFNERAKDWKWQVNVINSKMINAFCMPGGKIAFFTGIIDKLELTDDEVAIVMGHEVAHALREHARERIAKSELTHLGASILGQADNLRIRLAGERGLFSLAHGSLSEVVRSSDLGDLTGRIAHAMSAMSRDEGPLCYVEVGTGVNRALAQLEKPLDTNEFESRRLGVMRANPCVAAYAGVGAIGIAIVPQALLDGVTVGTCRGLALNGMTE